MNSSVARMLVLRFNVPNAVTMMRVALTVAIAWLLIERGRTETLLTGCS